MQWEFYQTINSLISAWFCVNLWDKPIFAGYIFPQFEHASQGLWHSFHFSALDALSFFRNTCRHRALNPLLVPRCVKCAVERRCWRISRNAIFAGREERSHLRSARGKCVNSITFHLPGGWVRALLSELGARQEWGGLVERTVEVMAIGWPMPQLRSHWRTKWDDYPPATAQRLNKILQERNWRPAWLYCLRYQWVLLDSRCSREIYI